MSKCWEIVYVGLSVSGSAYRGSNPLSPSQHFIMDEWHKMRYVSDTRKPIKWVLFIIRTTLFGSNPAVATFVGQRVFRTRYGYIDDALMVLPKATTRYKSPAYYEDIIVIRTRIAEIRSRSDPLCLRSYSSPTIAFVPRAKHCIGDGHQQKRSARYRIPTRKLLASDKRTQRRSSRPSAALNGRFFLSNLNQPA